MSNTSLNNQLAEVIFSISRTLRDEMTFDSSTYQLTLLQLRALIFIKKQKSVSVSDLAAQFRTTLPTATSLSDKLVKLKLVLRKQNLTDRRIVKISLTKKGKNLLKKAVKEKDKKINKMLLYLSAQDKKELFRILNNLLLAIKKTYEK